MADEITPRFNLVKPEVGGSADTWGDKWNENADKIDAAIIRLDEENVWSAPQRFDGGLYAGAIRLPAGTDLNTVVDSGFYRLEAPVVNAPVDVEHGQLIVSRGRDTIVQIVTGFDNGEIYWRQGNPPDVGGSGSWSAWHRFFHSGNLALPIGVGQTWQNMTGSREGGTTYTNTTGRTIAVAVMMDDSASAPFNGTVTFVVGGIGVARITSASPIFAIVPPGSTYRLNIVGSANIFRWFELM